MAVCRSGVTGIDRVFGELARCGNTSFGELTAPMLNEFIEKVVVHEADKSTGDRRQKVDIYFNFIGCFAPPKPEVILTAEEEAKVQKALAARNREREQNKRSAILVTDTERQT